MNFRQGELVISTRGDLHTAVWDPSFSRGLDVITSDELVLVVESTNESGWTQVMTPRGIQGYIHKLNIQRPRTPE